MGEGHVDHEAKEKDTPASHEQGERRGTRPRKEGSGEFYGASKLSGSKSKEKLKEINTKEKGGGGRQQPKVGEYN